jgi:hypothetical protein
MTPTERIEQGELSVKIIVENENGGVLDETGLDDELISFARIGERAKPLLQAASELLEDQCDRCDKYIAQYCTAEPVKCDVITTRKAIDSLLAGELVQDQIGERERWILVGDGLPINKVSKHGIAEPEDVLCTDGKEVFKAYYVPQYAFKCEDMGYFEGDTDIGENGEEYWPEGWYECAPEHGDDMIDWALGAVITHWRPMPLLPGGAG